MTYTLSPALRLVLSQLESAATAPAEAYNTDSEGDSLIGYNARRLGARDHPPAPGRSALRRVIP